MKCDLRPLGLVLAIGLMAALAVPPALGSISLVPCIITSTPLGPAALALFGQDPNIRVRDGAGEEGTDDEGDFMGHRWNPAIAYLPPLVDSSGEGLSSPPAAE